jgi:hypothetical protein
VLLSLGKKEEKEAGGGMHGPNQTGELAAGPTGPKPEGKTFSE